MLLEQRARFAYTLILPALALITLLNLYPLIEGAVISLQRQNLMRPNPDAWIGFAHYMRALVGEEDFWPSLGRTIVFTVFSVIGAYLVGLALALMLNLDIWGRGMLRALFLIPWVIPDVCTALVWKWLYGDEIGIINFLLNKVGLINSPILWLSNPDIAMPAVIIVQIWKLYPVMFITMLAALQNVPKDLHESAMLDGASPIQRFWYVTLPFIRPTSVVITLLACIWVFQHFDTVYLLTGGGPARATQVLPTLIYEKGFIAFEMGYASALGMLTLVCLMILSVAYLMAYRAQHARV